MVRTVLASAVAEPGTRVSSVRPAALYRVLLVRLAPPVAASVVTDVGFFSVHPEVPPMGVP